VANQIEVRLASSSERTDLDIAAAAVLALEEEAFVPIEKLDVTVSKGWFAPLIACALKTAPAR
jgi:hypothetical protein